MQKYSTPFWETLVLCGSFVLLWAWFLARKAAERANTPLPVFWQFFLLVALGLLAFVTLRRIRRVLRALRGEDEQGHAMPPYPMFGNMEQGNAERGSAERGSAERGSRNAEKPGRNGKQQWRP